MKNKILFMPLVVFCTTTASLAITSIEERGLKALDPATRLEQRCDIEAMERLAKETKWSPDKVLAYAFSDPRASSHHIKAKGAAFRAKGNWYHLSYDCHTDDSNLVVQSFNYKIGSLIPRDDWDEHYLVP